MKIKITPKHMKTEWEYDDNTSIFTRFDKEGRECTFREWWVNEVEEHKANGVVYCFGRNIYTKRICSARIEKGKDPGTRVEFQTEEEFQNFLTEHKVQYK